MILDFNFLPTIDVDLNGPVGIAFQAVLIESGKSAH